MKALVAVKEVAIPDDDFEIEDGRISEEFLGYDLNEWDDYGIEEVVQLKEDGVVDEVVSVTVGSDRVEETIRKALAKGVDRAIRIWDDDLDEGLFLDPNQKAEVLAKVVESEEPDLVFSGVQAGDDLMMATGVSLAQKIGYEWASVAIDIDYDVGNETAKVHRELEGGAEEVVEIDFPAVFTVQTGLNEPRYASLRGIRKAQSKEIDIKTLDNLGLSAEDIQSPIELGDLYEPEEETETEYVEGSTDEIVTELANIFEDEGVIA